MELGTLTPAAARFLEACVIAGLNIIVSGGTQAGKTTIVAGPLNYVGANPKVTCTVPQPSK